MKHGIAFVAVSILFFVAGQAGAAEATFDRVLTVRGKVDLKVGTGAGTIHLTHGSDSRVHIFGRVRSIWGANSGKVAEIAGHPPIEQTGNIIRIGGSLQNLKNIGIDYEIEAPAGTFLNAETGSGDINDDGVGADSKFTTGSGSIHLTGVAGGFSAETGSGSIYAEQAGSGDVKAETGSGSIELRNLKGGLKAETGSGSIKIGGTPTAPWKVEAGAGSVEFWSGSASFTLDAETGMGGVEVDRQISSAQQQSRQEVKAKIGNGGPLVKIETGMGSIHIH
jgi:hypothetical protein